MTVLPLRATSLAAVAYDSSHHLLCVQFRDGDCYQYAPVPFAMFADLLAADSKGVFFNQNIRRRFLFVKLPPRFLI